jgi:hypothetical protein
VLSGAGLVATRHAEHTAQLVTGGAPITEGRHYYEAQITSSGGCEIFFGAVRPGLDHSECRDHSHAYFVDTANGGLWGGDRRGTDQQGQFAEGDRIGMLIDLDAGWMRFYHNGQRCGPGFTEGVTGPLVCAAQLLYQGDALTALQGAEAPGGAGAADEAWQPWGAGVGGNGSNDIDTRACRVRFTESRADCPGHTPDHTCDPAVTLNGSGERHSILYYHVPAAMEYRFAAAQVTARTISIYVGDTSGHSRDMQLLCSDSGAVLARFTVPQTSGWHTFPVIPTASQALSLRTLTCYPAYGSHWTYLYRVRFGQ